VTILKRVAAIILAFALFAGAFSGCSNADSAETTVRAHLTAAVATTNAAKDGEPVVTPAGTLPLVTGGELTMTILMPSNDVVTDPVTNELFVYLQEQSGITLNYRELPSADFSEALDLLLAGGTDIPDIIAGANIGVTQRTKLGQAGILEDLKSYIKEYAFFLPLAYNNCSYTDWDTALSQITSANGAIYGLPSYAESPNDRVSTGRLNVYMPWVAKAGMESYDENGEFFTSMDELLTFYDLVKNGDYNENGESDEICCTTDGGHQICYAFVPMFTHHQANTSFYIDTINDVVDTFWNKESYREALRFIAGLVENGYIDPNAFTQSTDSMNKLLTADKPVCASFVRISSSNLSGARASEYVWAAGLSAPGSTDRYIPYNKPSSYVQYYITKNCTNIAAAVRLGDYWGSEEVSFINNRGFEGHEWVPVTQLEGYEDKYVSLWGYPLEECYFSGLSELTSPRANWGKPQNVWMQNMGVSVLSKDKWACNTVTDATSSTLDSAVRNASKINYHTEICDRDSALAGQVYSAEELELIEKSLKPVEEYARRSFVEFCTGVLDIDTDWDFYLKDLDDLGLKDLLKAENACYVRMNQ